LIEKELFDKIESKNKTSDMRLDLLSLRPLYITDRLYLM